MWLGRGSDVEAIMVRRAIEKQDVTNEFGFNYKSEETRTGIRLTCLVKVRNCQLCSTSLFDLILMVDNHVRFVVIVYFQQTLQKKRYRESLHKTLKF